VTTPKEEEVQVEEEEEEVQVEEEEEEVQVEEEMVEEEKVEKEKEVPVPNQRGNTLHQPLCGRHFF
jgi:hypothetical protein